MQQWDNSFRAVTTVLTPLPVSFSRAGGDTFYWAAGDENSLYSLRLQIFSVNMKTGIIR